RAVTEGTRPAPGRGGGRGGAAAGAGRGGGRGRAAAEGATGAAGDDQPDDAAPAVFFGRRGQPPPKDGGALTPLVYAVRANDLESVQVLLAAGADVNQTTGYGWSPLLV